MQELMDDYWAMILEDEKIEHEAAIAKNEFETMKAQEDSFLSVIKEKFDGSNVTVTDRAFRDPQFIAFKVNLSKKRVDHYLAQSKLNSSNKKLEAIRSIISFRKEEINKFRG